MPLKEEILNKITRWCAYQDRSEFEVKQKLLKWGIKEEGINEVIEYLNDENYLNNERFVNAFIRGKMNSRKWGLEKIKYHLKQKHHIPDALIEQCFQKLNKEEYLEQLRKIIIKKLNLLRQKEENNVQLKKKIINFALSKGYEYASVMEVLKSIKF